MRILPVILMALMAGTAAAQDGGAPVLSTEAPVQPGTPAGETGSALPSLPAETPAESGNQSPAAPATEAAGTPPAAEVTPAAPAAGAPATPDAVTATPVNTVDGADAPAGQVDAQADTRAEAGPDGQPGAGHRGGRDHGRPEGAAGHGGPATGPAAGPGPETLPVATDLLSIVLHAHWVVLWVMIGLAVAAFATLVILIHKTVEFGLAFRKLGRVARILHRAGSLDEAETALSDLKGPGADMVRASAEELRLAAHEPALQPGVRERTSAALARIEAGASQRLRAGTGILASIGSLAPFVGLFGTVFGIMNSFLAIAETKTTNLAVVAPGIAEALFATAIGLAAAIPAVLIYNICARRLAKYRHRMADVAAAAERLQSRALDRLAAGV